MKIHNSIYFQQNPCTNKKPPAFVATAEMRNYTMMRHEKIYISRKKRKVIYFSCKSYFHFSIIKTLQRKVWNKMRYKYNDNGMSLQ